MINQNIEQLLQQAVDQSLAQTQESRDLSDEVAGKIAAIDLKVMEAEQRTETAIADVNAAIPTAVHDTLNTFVWLDINNPDSPDNDGSSPDKAFNSLETALSSAATFGFTEIRMIDGTNIYPLDFKFVLVNQNITINLRGNCIEQRTYGKNLIGKIHFIGNSSIYFAGSSSSGKGKLITAMKDSDYENVSRDSAFFSRTDNTKSRVSMFGVEVDLGDQPLFATGGTANGLNEFSFGHGIVNVRDGVTEPILVLLNNTSTYFGWTTSTLPVGYTLAQLFSGIVYAVDGEPRNVISINTLTEA